MCLKLLGDESVGHNLLPAEDRQLQNYVTSRKPSALSCTQKRKKISDSENECVYVLLLEFLSLSKLSTHIKAPTAFALQCRLQCFI